MTQLLPILFHVLLAQPKPGPLRTAGVLSPPRQEVQVLSLGTSEEQKKTEATFATELGLALEDVRVRRVPAPAGFGGLPLAGQLRMVRQNLRTARVVAITWIDRDSPRSIFLHMVVLNGDRTLVRMLTGDPAKRGFAVDLAMACRELLGEALLFVAQPVSKPLKKIVKATLRKIARPRPSRWSLSATADAFGGVYGQVGPWFSVGSTISLEHWFSRRFRLRYSLQASTGVWGGDTPYPVKVRAFGPGFGILAQWRVGKTQLGPSLELRSVRSSYLVDASPILSQGFDHWKLLAEAGVEVRLPLLGHLGVVMGAYATFASNRQAFRLESTGQRIFSSPFVGWRLAGGLSLVF